MEKLSVQILSLLFVMLLTACGDDDSAPSYELDTFIGEWELTHSTNAEFESCPDNPPILVISQEEIEFPVINGSGCDAGSLTTDYTFNGQSFNMTVSGFDISYTIQSASESEFTWKDSFEGNTETYSRVN